MRAGWMKKGIYFYYFAAFTFVFMMQAFFSLVANFAAMYGSIQDKNVGAKFGGGFDWAGILVWMCGFGIEVVADW